MIPGLPPSNALQGEPFLSAALSPLQAVGEVAPEDVVLLPDGHVRQVVEVEGPPAEYVPTGHRVQEAPPNPGKQTCTVEGQAEHGGEEQGACAQTLHLKPGRRRMP